MGTLDLSRDSEKGNGCTWCWREVGWCVCVHTRVHMLARIRLRARVCSVLREHMCTVLCTHVCSVRYVNMCVFMHPCVQVCVGGHVCVCSHRHCQYVCVHTLTHTRRGPQGLGVLAGATMCRGQGWGLTPIPGTPGLGGHLGGNLSTTAPAGVSVPCAGWLPGLDPWPQG